MRSHRRRSRVYYLVLLIGLIIPVGISLLADSLTTTFAQAVSFPIARHTVLYWAYRYLTYEYDYAGTHYTHFPYCWGYADSVVYLGEPGHGACNVCCEYFSSRLSAASDCDPLGCRPPDCDAGTDCSGFVTRVWGRPIREKYGTCTIPDHAVYIPYNDRENDLPRRMRMGDVFNDCNNHVVLLYYFDPVNGQPHYYESTCFSGTSSYDGVRTHSGWDDLSPWGGSGYHPYRYRASTTPSDRGYIRDDIYLPWLAHAWYNAESTLLVRNNGKTALGNNYVLQHTIYTPPGGDESAENNKTYSRATTDDIWELPTAILTSGTFVGSGVVAADAGTGAVVYIEGGNPPNQALAYTGIYPFSSLGMATADTLYMPFFMYHNPSIVSKIFVQNAGKVATDITATYYGDDGRTCLDTRNLAPWGMHIFNVDDCWGGQPPTSGSVRLTSSNSQPLAAITSQWIHWERSSGYNAFSQGGQLLFAPYVWPNFWGWHTYLHVQNVGTGEARDIRVRYYNENGTYICQDILADDQDPLQRYRHREIDHANTTSCVQQYQNQTLSARIEADQDVVAVVNARHDGDGELMTYNVLPAGKTRLVLPFVRNGVGAGWTGNWGADILIQDTRTTTGPDNEVYVDFYDQAGEFQLERDYTLPPGGSVELYGQIPANFSGSAVIQATYPVAAIANLQDFTLQDGAISYNAIEHKGITVLSDVVE